jgi:hypothetical protein
VIKHGGQANSICELCRVQLESSLHMIAQCAYLKSVWAALSIWFAIPLQTPPTNNFLRLKTWWRHMLQVGTPSVRDEQDRMQKLIYTVWHIWKAACVLQQSHGTGRSSFTHQARRTTLVQGLESISGTAGRPSKRGNTLRCSVLAIQSLFSL